MSVDALPQPRQRISDETAYIAPMAVFLVITWFGGNDERFYPVSYAVKAVIVAIMLAIFWKRYATIRWNHAALGVMVGVLVCLQWVGMEKLADHFFDGYWKWSHPVGFDPYQKIASPGWRWAFILVRWSEASLLVPVMEELFWRDYLWRSLIAPNDFHLASIGEWDRKAFLIVAIIFGAGVHVEWLTAIVCGLIYGWLLVRTKSIGACIIAHGVTNFLLGGYVLYTHDWIFW